VARNLLRIKHKGVELELELAREFDPALIRQYGTVIVGEPDDERRLREEHHVMKELGFDADFVTYAATKVVEMFGTAQGKYVQGLFVPEDAIVNSTGYVQAIARWLGEGRYQERNSVTALRQENGHVRVQLQKGDPITARFVVIATNGFLIDRDPNLQGKLRSLWTFLASFDDPGPNTPNAYYFDPYDHYWARQDSKLIVGGEDAPVADFNYHAPANGAQSLDKLTRWAQETFPRLAGTKPLAGHYSVFGETRDNLPILGAFSPESRIFYIVGDNGDGQSTLSYIAYLLPFVMGFRRPSAEEQSFIRLLSPLRDSLAEPAAKSQAAA
jgi:glycine/D-amino acid oxidase-like deaminating enzyme